MAETRSENKTRTAFAPFDFGGFDFKGFDYKAFEAASQTWKDFAAQQIRATYAVAEQSMALSRKASEYFATQAQEALKYQQEAVKYSMGVADDVRKAAFETAERTVR